MLRTPFASSATGLTAVLAIAGCAYAATPVSIDRVAYHGWPDCYRLTNGTVEIIVVPQIGRIMRYGFIDGDNALWEKGQTAGDTSDAAHWVNHGGDKTFPWPQDDWPARIKANWPPAFASEQEPHRVEIMDDHTLRMTSAVIKEYGVRIVRQIAMDDRGAGVALTTSFEQVAPGANIPLAVWTVAQVPGDATYYARVAHGLSDDATWAAMQNTDWPGIKRLTPGVLEIKPTTVDAKVGINGDAVVAVSARQVFIQYAAKPNGDADHPKERLQMYSAPAVPEPAADRRSAYVELEFISSRRQLVVGESNALHVRWDLRHLEHPPSPSDTSAVMSSLPEAN